MKWKNKIWILVSFFVGVFICYLTLQYSYFETKKELDIPNIILSIITLLIGLFIAVTLQKRLNKSQNQHTYLVSKLDILWNSFNDFSQKLSYDTRVDISSIRKLMTDVIHPMSFLKSVFESFEVDDNCVCDLESKLENLESKLSNISAENNVIDFTTENSIIQNNILEINKCFSKVLKEIQDL
jgi:hypothetical protein